MTILGFRVELIQKLHINVSDYLKSTAMSIGISIVTAGVLSFIDKVAGGLQAFDVLANRARNEFGNIISGAS
jgi:hypothetical protein